MRRSDGSGRSEWSHGCEIAKALGAHVTVFSHSPNKESDARLWAQMISLPPKDPAALKALSHSFNLILNTVSAELDINSYLDLLTLDGTLVVIGLPGKPYAVNVGTLLGARRSMAGSMIGGIPEMQRCLISVAPITLLAMLK